MKKKSIRRALPDSELEVPIHLEPMDLSEGVRGDLTDPAVAHTYIAACLDKGMSLEEAMEEIMKAYARPADPWKKAN